MTTSRIAILGSGATGVSVARALLDENQLDISIDVIDFDYKPNNSKVVNKNKSFSEKDRHVKGYVLYVPEIFKTESHLEGGTSGSASFGGWAELWGASILRLSETELKNWPISSEELMPHWINTEKHIKFGKAKLHSSEEMLNRKVPVFIEEIANKSKDSLGVTLQISNLAISPISTDPQRGCNLCGQCLVGCPWGHIWSATRDWEVLLKNPNINYKSGYWIESIKENESEVTVHSLMENGQENIDTYDSIFVALGSIQTAALMLRSKISRENVTLRDSQTIITPFVLKNLKKTGDATPRISLSDGYAYYPNRKTINSDFENFYAQIYGFSESLLIEIQEKIKLTKFIPKPLLRFFLQRVGIAMCYFDQNESGKILVALDGQTTVVTPNLDGFNQKKLIKKIKKNLKQLGFIPLTLLAQNTGVGSSYHSGASFPMIKSPNGERNYSDTLGRPNGLKRTFIVDTSVFSELSTTPNTFNAMANARRIAKQFIKEFLNG